MITSLHLSPAHLLTATLLLLICMAPAQGRAQSEEVSASDKEGEDSTKSSKSKSARALADSRARAIWTTKAPRSMRARRVREHNAQLLELLDRGLPSRRFAWRYIVIHHTAMRSGDVERISRFHKRKFKDPDGIEYHFLIGNGRGMPMGYIGPGRWPLQKLAIHLFKPERAPQAIAISLVGNYHERKKLPRAQYIALRDLVARLSMLYDIPAARITTHTRVDGRLTVCPGKYFPFKKLRADAMARRARLEKANGAKTTARARTSPAKASPAPADAASSD